MAPRDTNPRPTTHGTAGNSDRKGASPRPASDSSEPPFTHGKNKKSEGAGSSAPWGSVPLLPPHPGLGMRNPSGRRDPHQAASSPRSLVDRRVRLTIHASSASSRYATTLGPTLTNGGPSPVRRYFARVCTESPRSAAACCGRRSDGGTGWAV